MMKRSERGFRPWPFAKPPYRREEAQARGGAGDFLRFVVQQCDKVDRESFTDCQYCRDDNFEDDEAAYVEYCRTALHLIAGRAESGSVGSDLLVHYILSEARTAGERAVPLVGDVARIKELTRRRLEGKLELYNTTSIGFIRKNSEGEVIAGASAQLHLSEDGGFTIECGIKELHAALADKIQEVTPLKEFSDQQARYEYLRHAAKPVMEAVAYPEGWSVSEIVCGKHLRMKTGDHMIDLDTFMPEPFQWQPFYAEGLIYQLLAKLGRQELESFVDFLDIADFVCPDYFLSEVMDALSMVHVEDVYRGLYYAYRANKEG